MYRNPLRAVLNILPLLLAVVTVGCVTPSRFENEYGNLIPASDRGAVVPTGMRRTVDGWEDASTWYVPAEMRSRSIDDWMRRQRDREPAWARRTIEEIRSTPPLMIAVIQITAIAAIFGVSRHHRNHAVVQTGGISESDQRTPTAGEPVNYDASS